MPDHIRSAPGLRPDVILRQNAPGGQQQRKTRAGLFIGRHIFGADEFAFAAHEFVDVHQGRAFGSLRVAGPLDRAQGLQQFVSHAGKRRCRHGDFVHDLRGVGIGPARTQGIGEQLRDLPIFVAIAGRHHTTHAVDPAFGIGKGAVFLKKSRAGQEDMRVIGGLVQEKIVDNHAIHRRQTGCDMLGVGVGLQNILALTVEALEGALDRRVEHIRDAQTRFTVDFHAPEILENRANRVVLHVTIPRQLMRKRTHVTGSLHVVLPAQRVHANPGTPNISGQHREVGDADHRGRALRMFGDAQAIVDRAIAAFRVKTRCGTHVVCLDSGQELHGFRAVIGRRNELGVVLEFVPITAGADEFFIKQTFGHNHVRYRCDDCDVGAGRQGKVILGLDMRTFHQISAARVDDDQFGTLAQTLLQTAGKDRVAVGRIGANDDHDIGLFNRIKILCAS